MPNSLNRETMLNHVYSNRPKLYNYTHCAYGKPSYLFYESSNKMSEDGTQHGDPEAPPLFAETFLTLVKQLESKINIWYLDDGNLVDDYKVVLRDLKNILKSEQIYGLSLNTEKCERCFLGPTTSTQYNSILITISKNMPQNKNKNKRRTPSFQDLQSANFAKQSLSSIHIPSVLEPRHLFRTNQNRPDGLTLVAWAVGKQLLWDVTVLDSLAPCRINAGSVCNLVRLPLNRKSEKLTSIKIL